MRSRVGREDEVAELRIAEGGEPVLIHEARSVKATVRTTASPECPLHGPRQTSSWTSRDGGALAVMYLSGCRPLDRSPLTAPVIGRGSFWRAVVMITVPSSVSATEGSGAGDPEILAQTISFRRCVRRVAIAVRLDRAPDDDAALFMRRR